MTSSIDDHVAIQRLLVDYSFFLDTGQIDRLGLLFVENAVFDQRPTGIDIVSKGRGSILAMLGAAFEQFQHTIHYVTNVRLDIPSAGQAHGTSYFQAISILKTGQRTEYLGRYEDEFSKVGDKWLFAKRVLQPHLPVRAEGFAMPANLS